MARVSGLVAPLRLLSTAAVRSGQAVIVNAHVPSIRFRAGQAVTVAVQAAPAAPPAQPTSPAVSGELVV